MNGAESELERQGERRARWAAAIRAVSTVVGGVLLGMVAARVAGAQGALSPSVFVRPDPSPYLTDWERDPAAAYLNIVNGSAVAFDYRLDAFVRVNGREIGRVRSPVLTAVPGGVQVFGLTEVLEWSTVSRDANVVTVALRTGRLPEGRLSLCVQPLTAASQVVGAPTCTDREIRLPEPPQLLSPANETKIVGVQPLFQWAPVTATPGSALQYRIRVVERQPEQTPAVAMEANPAHFAGTVPVAAPVLVYPADALPFREDRDYAWRVEVVDANGTPVTRDGRASEIWTFRAGDLTTPTPRVADLPDVIIIAPGVAELSGLRSATVTPANNEFGLRVDGTLTLSLYLPFRADVRVTATGVMLDRLRLPNFRMLAGTLSGTLDPKDVPATLSGPGVRFTDVRIEPGTGMTVGGALVLGGRDPVPMEGRLRVMFGNFEGVLQATRPFFRSGPGPLAVELRRATARYPGALLEVFGGLGLFDAETQCGLRLEEITDDASRFAASCPAAATAPLAGGANGVQLTLRGVQGEITVPAGRSTTLDYALRGIAGIGFSGAEACAGRFAFSLSPQGFERSDPDAACTDTEGSLTTHGTIGVKAHGLEVRTFTWTQAAGFDYDLRTTLELDGLPPLVLPRLEGVRLTPAGVAFDAATRDADATERRGISSLPQWPFALRQVRLAAGRVPWDVWGDARRNPFDLDFDGALGVAAFQRQLPRDCAWTMRVPFSGATIRNNTVRIPVDGPMGAGCVIPLSTDSAPGLLVERMRGAFVYEARATDNPTSGAVTSAATTEARQAGGGDLLATIAKGLQVPDAGTLAREAAAGAAQAARTFIVQLAETERPAIVGAFLVRDIFKCPSAAPPGGIGPVQPPGTALKRLPITEAFRIRTGGTAEAPIPIVVGEVSGFAPDCPIELPALRIARASGVLRFFEDNGRQGITFSADAEAELLLARQPTPGRGRIVLDLVAGRMLEGSIAFQGPLRIEVPTSAPVLTFEVNAVDFRPDGLHIDGRARLLPDNMPAIAATFAGVVINPATRAMSAGTVSFDAPFALEVGIDAAQAERMTLRAVARDADLSLTSGIRLDLPTAIALTPLGLTVRGAGAARMAYDGREFPALVTRFSDDFAWPLDGTSPVRGRVDFEERGTRLAWIDARGFHADFAGLIALVPARLPLPEIDLAYLQLRADDGTLLVEAQPAGKGVRIFTRPRQAVSLAVPALAERGVVPQLDVSFDLTLDEAGRPVAGAVQARVPEDRAAAFDLRPRGIPLRLDAISFSAPSGQGFLLQFDGRLDLFGASATSASAVRLTMASGGRITTVIDTPTGTVIQMGSDPRAPRVTLARLQGVLEAELGARSRATFEIHADGRLELPLGDGAVWGARARLLATQAGVTVEDLVADAADAAVEIDGVRLALKRLRIPRLAWSPVTNTFDWEAQFDIALALRQLPGLELPEIRDVLLRPTGLVIPATTFPDLSVGNVDWQGFQVRPLALRMARTDIDWTAGRVRGAWGIGLDLGIAWTDPSGNLPAGLRGVELTALNVGVTNGRLTGRLAARPIGNARWPLGDDPQGLAIRLRELAGQLLSAAEAGRPEDANRTPYVDVTVVGDLELGSRCVAAPERGLEIPRATLRLRANGRLEGTLSNIVPPCPITLGLATLEPGPSTIGFGVPLPQAARDAGSPAAWLSASGRVRLPAPGGAMATLEGRLAIDLASGTLLEGSLALTSPLQVGIPSAQPVVRLTATTGSLDPRGLRLEGTADVFGAAGERLTTATLKDFTLRLRDFAVTDGTAQFDGAVSLTAATRAGATLWSVGAGGAALPAAPFVRLTSPDRVTLSRDGLSVSGTASAQAALSADLSWPALSVQFADGFALGLTPFAIQAGRADLFVNGRRVAYADRAGLFPDDVLAALPNLPDSIPVPSWGTAYLRLKDARGQFVAQTGLVGSNGLQLTTRPGAPLQLVLAGLRRSPTADAPVVNVDASVIVNRQTFVPMSGSIVASAPTTGPPLVPLADLGVPIAIRRIALDVPPSGPRLVVSGSAALPASLSALPLQFDALEVSANGLAGVVEVGSFDAHWVPGRVNVASMVLDGTAPNATTLAVTGARLELGATPALRLSGALRSPLFSNGGGGPPAPLFYTATVTTSGATFAVDPSSLAGGALPLGPATFTLAAVGGAPAAALVATAQEVALTLSGVLRVPALDPAFRVSLAGFRVSSASGLTLPQVTVEGAPSFLVGGVRVTLGDPQTTGAALALERAGDSGLALTVVGSVEATGDATLGSLAVCPAGPPTTQRLRARLRITTAGAVSGRFEDFVPRCPLAVGPLSVQPGPFTLGINTPITDGQPARTAWLSGSLVASLATFTNGTPVTARGTAAFDLTRGELIDGQLTLDAGAGLDLPRDNPILRLRNLTGAIDGASVRLSGTASLAVPGLPTPVNLSVDGVRVDVRTAAITDGSVSIGTSLALQAALTGGALDWSLVDPATPVPANATFARLVTPPSITLSSQGLTFGAGAGSVTYAVQGESPQPLDVQLIDGFALRLSPFGVERGRADFRLGTRRVAYLDARGLWPDDVLALVPPLPDRIPLPDLGTAYLELRRNGQFVVASALENGQVRLQMLDETATARLVLPALREGTAPPPEIAVRFSLLVNGRTWAVSSGELDVNTPDNAPALLSLASRGVPVELRRLRFVADAQGSRFTVAARAQLPSALGNLPVRFEGLTLSARGLEGAVEVGRFDEAFVESRPVLGTATPFADARDTMQVQLTGARLELSGAQSALKLSGRVRTTLFAAPTATGPDRASPFFFSGTASATGLSLGLTPLSTSPTVAVGPAQFDLRATATAPAVLLTASAQGVTLSANGTLRAPSLSATFAVDVTDLRVGTGGVSVGSVRVARPEAAELDLGGVKLSLKDTVVAGQPVTPALSLTRATDGVWTFSLNGSLLFRDDPFSAALPGCAAVAAAPRAVGVQLQVSTSGAASGTFSNLAPRCPIRLGAVTVTPGPMTFGLNAPLPSGASANGPVVAWISGAATAEVAAPPGGGTPIRVAGNAVIDLTTPTLLGGSLALQAPARVGFPAAKPIATLEVTTARLDRTGLVLSGSASVVAGTGATLGVQLNDFTLGFADLTVRAGSAVLQSNAALVASVTDGALGFALVPASLPPPSGAHARLTLPSSLSIDAQGISLADALDASVVLPETDFPSLRVLFDGGFRIGWAPLAVASGRADFRVGDRRVAYLDASGLHPDDVLALASSLVPDTLPLGDKSTAYLLLREGGQLVLGTNVTPTQISLATTGSQRVKLVIPALRPSPSQPVGPSNLPRVIETTLSLTVSRQTLTPMSGSIDVQAAANQALFDLSDAGLPLQVTRVGFAAAAGGYRLTVGGAVALPASLASLNLTVPELSIGPSGISGVVELGHPGDNAFVPNRPAIASAAFSPTPAGAPPAAPAEEALRLEVTGVRVGVVAGSGPSVRVVGRIRSALFMMAGSSAPADAPLFFTGSVAPAAGGVAMNVAVQQVAATNTGIAIGPARLDVSAVRFAATPQEVSVGLDGTLAVPAAGNTFTLAVNNLELSSTRGVVVRNIALGAAQGPTLTLFGLQFALQDITRAGQTYRALAVDRPAPGTLGLTLAGQVTVLEARNTTTFYGLRITTAGEVSLAGASLLSQPVDLVPGTARIKTIDFEQGQMRATFGVTLPAPLATGEQEGTLRINRDGTVTGGAQVTLLAAETRPICVDGGGATCASANRLAALGPVAMAYLRWAGLDVEFSRDFATLSRIRAIADLHLGSTANTAEARQKLANNRIRFGDLNGTTPVGGFSVTLGGTVSVTNVTASDFTFEFGAVTLRVLNVAAPQNDAAALVTFGASLGMNLPSVAASVQVSKLRVLKTGMVDFTGAELGAASLSIPNVLHASLTDLVYSTETQTISIAKGGIPTVGAKAPTGEAPEQVEVNFLLSFSGSLSLMPTGANGAGAILSGSVQRFLFARETNGNVRLVIKGAALKAPPVFEMTADVNYRQVTGGFDLTVGATAKIKVVGDVIIFGAIESRTVPTAGDPPLRLGLFVAANGLRLPLTPVTPVAYLAGLGGGFFWQPRREWIDNVQTAAGLQPFEADAMRLLTGGGQPSFAVMLYAALNAPDPEGKGLKGKVLLTLTNTGFGLNGSFELMDQGDNAKGTGQLVIGWRPLGVLGSLNLRFQFGVQPGGKPPAVTAVGSVRFAFLPDRWAVIGTAQAYIMCKTAPVGNQAPPEPCLLQAQATVAAAAAGFYASVTVQPTLPVSFITIKNITAKVFYVAPNATDPAGLFGIYGEIRVGFRPLIIVPVPEVELFLKGAFVTPPVMIYVAGGIIVDLPPIVPRKEFGVYARFKAGEGVTAGLGKDPAMEALLERAAQVAGDMETVKQEAGAAVDAAASLPPAPPLSAEELARAFATIGEGLNPQFDLSGNRLSQLNNTFLSIRAILIGAVLVMPDRDNGASPAAVASIDRYMTALRNSRDPDTEAAVTGAFNAASTRSTTVAGSLASARARINAITTQVTPFLPSWSAGAFEDPSTATLTAIGQPETHEPITANDTVRVENLRGGPALTLDANKARSNTNEGTTSTTQADQQVQALRQRVGELESLLQSVRGATTASTGGSPMQAAGEFARAVSGLEAASASFLDYLIDRKRLYLDTRHRFDTSWWTDTQLWLLERNDQVLTAQPSNGTIGALANVIRNRLTALQAFTGNQNLLTQFNADLTASADRQALVRLRGLETGRQLYWQIGREGYAVGAQQLDQSIAQYRSTIDQRLGASRGAAVALTRAIDRLWQAQADAAGVLYDLYDRVLITVPDLTDAERTQFATRKSQLERLLRVPTVTGLRADVVTNRYLITTTLSWNATHPDGLTEFQLRDEAAGTNAGAFYSLGAAAGTSVAGTHTTYRAAAAPGQSVPNRQISIGARGGAGYLGRQSVTVAMPQIAEPAFATSPGPTGPSGSVPPAPGPVPTVAPIPSTSVPDATPPSTPVVELPGIPASRRINGTWWVNRKDELAVRWSASDRESGIGRFDYRFDAPPDPNATAGSISGVNFSNLLAAIRDNASWSNVGGRTFITLTQPDLPADGSVRAFRVRAFNGSGVQSGIGTTGPIRYDGTPPYWDPEPFSFNILQPTGIMGRPILSSAPAVGVTAAPRCMPTAFSAAPGVAEIGWNASFSPDPGAPQPGVAGLLPANALDALSGLGTFAYKLRIAAGTTPAVYDAATWQTAGLGQYLSVTAPGATAYDRDWILDVVPIDNAGNVGPVAQVGPFRFRDQSLPSVPEFCAVPNGTGVLVQLDTRATDAETDVVGYQYSLTRNGQLVRPFPNTGAVDGTHTWRSMQLADGLVQDGARHVLALRSVNGQGTPSVARASVDLIVDNSPPPTPTVTALTLSETGMCNGQAFDTMNYRCATATFSAPTDPHSGLATVEYRVESTATPPPGTLQTLRGAGSALQLLTGGPTFTSVPFWATTVSAIVPSAPGATITFRLRTVNTVGLMSAEGSRTATVWTPPNFRQFTAPATTGFRVP